MLLSILQWIGHLPTPPPTIPPNDSGQNVNSAIVEKPCFRQISPALGAWSAVHQLTDAGTDEEWLPKQNRDSFRKEGGKWILMDQPTMCTAGLLNQSSYLSVWLLFILPAFVSVAV